MISCEPSDLALAAKQFQKLHPEALQAIDTYLLAVIAGGSTDPSVLALAAKDFQKVSPEHLRLLMIYLLCLINGGTGGSSAAACLEWTPTDINLCNLIGYYSESDLAGITSITFNGTSSTGGFHIGTPAALVSLLFPNLTSVNGGNSFGITLQNAAAFTTLSVPVLATASVINLSALGALAALSFPALASTSGTFAVDQNPALASLSLPVLATVGGDLELGVQSIIATLSLPLLASVTGNLNASLMSALASASFPNLTSTGSDFSLSVDPLLTSLSAPKLATVGGVVNLSNNAILASLSFPLLTTVGVDFDVNTSASLATVNVPLLASIGGDFNISACAITSLTATALASIGGGINVNGNAGLVTFSLPNLASTNQDINGGSNNAMATVNLPKLVTTSVLNLGLLPALNTLTLTLLQSGGISINGAGLAPIASLSLPAWTNCGGSFTMVDCPSLAAVTAANVIFNDGIGINLSGCALNAASVNSILHRAVVSGVTACNIDLSGGTNAAPTGAGVADKATLITAGNTVSTN